MLILKRRQGECTTIGGKLTVKVVSIEGKGVRLGVEAPPDVPVRRHKAQPSPEKVAADKAAVTKFLAEHFKRRRTLNVCP